MLIVKNNKYYKICDDCDKHTEIKDNTYKINLKRKKHYCRSCGQKGNRNPMYGKKVWNKGLTKKTDERVKRYGKTLSVS